MYSRVKPCSYITYTVDTSTCIQYIYGYASRLISSKCYTLYIQLITQLDIDFDRRLPLYTLHFIENKAMNIRQLHCKL